MAQLDRVPATGDRGPEEDFFLDVGSQREQVHDLRDPRPADMTQAGERGIVRDDAGVEQLLEAQRQCQQTGDARQPSGCYRTAGFVLAGINHLATSAPPAEVQRAGDRHRYWHQEVSWVELASGRSAGG